MNRSKLIATLHQIKALAEKCLEDVSDSTSTKRLTRKTPAPSRPAGLVSIDFDKPLRPFMKNYAKGLSGPKKFVLVLSRLAKGDLNKEVALKEIQKHWNRMTAKDLLGMKLNLFYSAQARNNDWVESKKKGVYNLRPNWKQALEK